jgi:hypothetical protein
LFQQLLATALSRPQVAQTFKPGVPSAKVRVMAQTVLTVTPQHVGALDAKRAVEVVADLIWAELRRLGVPTTHANVSMRINVADGGVDASVNAADIYSEAWDDSFIPEERTAFQIKTGDSFKPWQKSDIKEELFGKNNKPARDTLADSVRECLDAGGTYVLVCTGTDPNEKELQQSIQHLETFFDQCGYSLADFDVWGQSSIIGLLQRFPGVALKVNGYAATRFQTHGVWSRQSEMRRELQVGDPQKAFIDTAQAELRKNDQPVHLRVRGEAGVGKTRLVREATAADDLRPLTLYFDGPSELLDGDIMTELLREGSDLWAILVVDECDLESRARIWNHLKGESPRIKFVSIYNDMDEPVGSTVVLDAPVLDVARVQAIIEGYGIPEHDSRRWAELCDGSPRVAHVVGESLKSHPDDFKLLQPDTAVIWDRFVAGNDDPNSDDVKQRRIVLQHIALFRRFGYKSRVANEGAAIAGLVAHADPQITAYRFREIVQLLRTRKVLQGENTFYITPRLLHITLWADWWNVHGDNLDLEAFLKPLPQELIDWFHEMFQYARESPAALKIAETLLDERGIFGDKGFFVDGRAARFFRALTDAAPQAALRNLQRMIGEMDVEQLLAFGGDQRRQVVWSLEAIAVWRELFADAARLLLRLAEAENENFGNNATGVFAELFSPGQGPVAPSEASPEERFPVLKEALESPSARRREIGFGAAAEALKTGFFSRMIGSEYQGLRKPPKLWVPATWGELFDAYRRVWYFLRDRLPSFEPHERAKAIEILTGEARGLWSIYNLFDMVTDTLADIAKAFPDSRTEIVEAVETTIHYDGKGLDPERLSKLESLRKTLINADFRSQLKRFVAMDLIHDRFDGEGKYTEGPSPELKALAAEAVANPDVLMPELAWLTGEGVKNGYQFGYELARADEGFTLLPALIEAQRETGDGGNAFFLSGYLAILFQRDVERWEGLLDAFAAEPNMRSHVAQLTWRSGMTERAALRVLAMSQSGHIPHASLRMFSYGGVVRNIPEHVFALWIEALLQADTDIGAATAIDLYHFFYLMGETVRALPHDLTLRLLTAPPLFRESESRLLEEQDYDWTQVAAAFLNQYPEDGLSIARAMLSSFGEDGTVTGRFNSETEKILNSIAKAFPNEVWEEVAALLGPPIDSRAFHIRQWLRKGGLTLLPQSALWQWIDADIEKRAWYAAMLVPTVLTRSGNEGSWARELLVRYGNRKDVRSNLHANFGTEAWSGPESSHYESKKRLLEDFRRGESDANVTLWLDEAIDSLEHRIADARLREERGF